LRNDFATLRDNVLDLCESSTSPEIDLQDLRKTLVTLCNQLDLIDTSTIDQKDLIKKVNSDLKNMKVEAERIFTNQDNYSKEISKDFIDNYNPFVDSIPDLESLTKRELGLISNTSNYYTNRLRSFTKKYSKVQNQVLPKKSPKSKPITKKPAVDEYDIKGFKVGMTIEEAVNAIYENLSDWDKEYYKITSLKECNNVIKADIREIQQFYKAKRLYREYLDAGESFPDAKNHVIKTMGITRKDFDSYGNSGASVETKIIKTRPNINQFIASGYDYSYGGIYTYGEISSRSGEGFEVRFTNDEFGRKIYSIDYEVDLGIDAVNESESISKKAINKYREPKEKKKLLDADELYGWSYCWGDCDWNEKHIPDDWDAENAKFLKYKFYRSWQLPGTGRLNIKLWDSAYTDDINARFEKEQKEIAMKKVSF